MDRKRFLQLSGMLLPIPFIGCVPKSAPATEAVEGTAGKTDKFTFAFFTDVHLSRDNRGDGDEGLRMALDDAKARKVDFILFGGDNVETDHMKPGEAADADALHARFKGIVDACGLPCHFTIGNHDRYYHFNGEEDKTGYKQFEKYMGPSRSAFDHKGMHFIALNSLNPDENGNYSIGKEEMEWLRADLEKTGKDTPLVVSLHVPMLSLYYPVVEGNFKGLDMVTDTKPLFDLLNGYNLKLVLQGHQHIHEEIQERNRWFVTAGAISAYWWKGPFLETEEGYLLVHVDNENHLTWEYIDYGWKAREPKPTA